MFSGLFDDEPMMDQPAEVAAPVAVNLTAMSDD